MTTIIFSHFMPWEIDYAITMFSQLNRSHYYIPQEHNVKIRTTLNLSSYGIDWELSNIPKEYFIEKYNTLGSLLNKYDYISNIYEGPDSYGHLDVQREQYKEKADYYMTICPDIYFSEYTISYMLQAAQQIQNEYFYITPEICTLWDSSWDIITNTKIGTLDHNNWIDRDIFDIDYYMHKREEDIKIKPISTFKWAGWFDLSNRAFIETFGDIPDEWSGYGAWDLYTMTLCHMAQQRGYDFQQYLLEGQIIFPYSHGVGPFKPPNDGLVGYYKNQIHCKSMLANQRESFNANINFYINRKISKLRQK
jgi:hypothetical protein